MAVEKNYTRKARKLLLKDIFNVKVKCETRFNFHLTTKISKTSVQFQDMQKRCPNTSQLTSREDPDKQKAT